MNDIQVRKGGRVVRRDTMIVMLQAALLSGEQRFARQAALAWLAAFPGDLEITLLQARAVLAGDRPSGAAAALELICRKDPFFADAHRVLARAAGTGSASADRAAALSALFVLDGHVPDAVMLEPWSMALRQAWVALQAQEFDAAGQYADEGLRLAPDLLLAAALRLLADRSMQEPQAVAQLAETYHTRWPECLPITLTLAEAYLRLGSEPEAVRLLHQCAAADAAGQVARRLWGEQHPYRSLWPEDMLILFDQPIPAGVAARLGWNHLPPGEPRAVAEITVSPVEAVMPSPAPQELPESGEQADPSPAEAPAAAMDAGAAAPGGLALAAKCPEIGPDIIHAVPAPEPESPEPAEKPQPEPRPGAAASQGPRQKRQAGSSPSGTAQAVSGEFEKLARKLKQPDLGRADGRQPVYVIMTSREGLAGQYGPQTAAVVEGELRKLAGMVRQRPRWSAALLIPDDAACMAQYGLTPVSPRDPWKLKNALADLDGALRKRGEMIGALLIVGGDAVVPFHRLPNPTDDADGEVLSDSPYATQDANYFVPEWPVGRLPGGRGPDAGYLLEQLRQLQRYHARRKGTRVFLGLDWMAVFRSFLELILPAPKTPSFGYTAAVWRRSSLAVFRPIGAPHTVTASPPVNSGSVDRARITAARLGYYNLHGLCDSPAWYGQRDPQEGGNGPDYPVALSPADLRRNGHAPSVIFSEACFGGHILDKGEEESLALKFLSLGTLAVVASTCTAYGSVNTPLIAADLLGNLFWQHLKAGYTAGEALFQAKVDLVREMNTRQGFLDGEDQKTLIAFVLYGDPLAGYDGFRVQSKAAFRRKDHPLVKTVADHPTPDVPPALLSGDALKQVKQIVAEYLPGAEFDEMHFARQPAPNGAGEPGQPAKKGRGGERVVVTISKQVQVAQLVHRHYARVTLDAGGKPVKFSLSR